MVIRLGKAEDIATVAIVFTFTFEVQTQRN
jgi:hypothetical protein